jgi:beta-lactamase class A
MMKNKTAPDINLGRRRCMMLLASLPLLTVGTLKTDRVLAASRHDDLQQRVNLYIGSLRRRGIIKADEKTAWSVYDFSKREKLVSINEDSAYQSASMIKPFIALAYFYKCKYDSKHYHYPRNVRQKMEAMIRYSDNQATNFFIRLLSNKSKNQRPMEVEKILKRHAPGIFQQTRIREYIPYNGRTYRNKASARDYSRFLYALWHNELPYSQELKRLMSMHRSNRISVGVDIVPSATRVYDKTGTTARLCGDMGIMEAVGRDGNTYPYTFIGIIEKQHRAKNYGQWAKSRSNVIRAVSRLVYADMKQRYPLI